MGFRDEMSLISLGSAVEDKTVPARVEDLLTLYDEMRPSLSAYLSARGYRASDIEDLVHESFLRLHRQLMEGVKIEKARGWLFRTAHNLAVNLVRDTRANLTDGEERVEEVLQRMPAAALNPEEQLLLRERYLRLERALSSLTEQQVECLQLRVEGLTYREIADVMGISLQRVAQIVSAGLKRLAVVE